MRSTTIALIMLTFAALNLTALITVSVLAMRSMDKMQTALDACEGYYHGE